MRNIVNALFVKNGSVLLARRSPQRLAYPNFWSFPGGHVDEGESLEEALIRELGEEVASVPIIYRLVGTINDPDEISWGQITYHMYVVTAWRGNPSIIDDEHSELKWFPFESAAALPDLALNAYKKLFRLRPDA